MDKRIIRQAGFNLIELLIALAIAGVLLGVGLPSYRGLIQDQNLKSVAEATYSQIKHAQSLALKRNEAIYLFFCQNGDEWRTALSNKEPCDCYTANSCTLNGQDTSADWIDGESLQLPDPKPVNFVNRRVKFSPVRLTANAGTIRIENAQHKELKVITSIRGRVRICQVGDVGLGYKECI